MVLSVGVFYVHQLFAEIAEVELFECSEAALAIRSHDALYMTCVLT